MERRKKCNRDLCNNCGVFIYILGMGSIYTRHPQHPWPVYNYTSSLWLADIYKPFVKNFCPSIQHVVGFLSILWHAKIYENSGEYDSNTAKLWHLAKLRPGYMKTLVNMSVPRQSCGTWQSSDQVSLNIEFPTPNLGEIGTAMSNKGIWSLLSVFQASILLIIIIITSRTIIMYF